MQPFIISVDKKGNVAFQVRAGLGEGSPSAGIGISFTKTNAPTVYDLNGWGASIGCSVGEIPYVGIDGNTYIVDKDIAYFGSSISIGGGPRISVPGEAHINVSNTYTYYSYNIFDSILKW